MRNWLLTAVLIFISATQLLHAQCFTDLQNVYCTNGIPDTIMPVDTGGYFDGDGISSDGIIYPNLLSPGEHTISYFNTQYYYVDTTGLYAPKTGVPNYVSLIDDGFSDGITIPFDFTFFGSYKSFVRIHSNGFVSFNFEPAFFPPHAIEIPTPGMPTDFIAAAWDDYDPTAGGTISWFSGGTAPDRWLAMQYTEVPPYGETEDLLTAQIVLYESSNIIEIHTTASADYGNRKTQGIENSDGTLGFVRPGRNYDFWSAYNDYVAFIPQYCLDTFIVASPPSINITEDTIEICIPYAGTMHAEGAETYSWLSSDIATMTDAGAPGSFYLDAIAGPGNYICTLIGENASGCSDTTSVVVRIENCPNTIHNTTISTIMVAPNPFISNCVISGLAEDDYCMRMYDSAGQLVNSKQGRFTSLIIVGETLPEGIFEVVLYGAGGHQYQVSIQHLQ